MSSGFPGGRPDLLSNLAGRSFAMNGNQISQPSYRSSSSQIPGIFLDQTTSSQIANRNLIGKRSYADYQIAHYLHQQQQHHHQQQQQQVQLQQNQLNPATNSRFLRSVKPRTYQNFSPNSPLDLDLQQSLSLPQRYNLPLIQQQQQQEARPYQQQQQHVPVISNTLPYVNNNTVPSANIRVQGQDSEKKMLNCLQELEKQLLDDEDDGDDVSVITNPKSEWSETIQNLFSPKQAVSPISPSPTTSSSSSSSPSVVSPATICSKQTVIEAATAVSEGKYDVASEILTRMSQVTSKGSSEQRLMEYVCSALKSRVSPKENPPLVAELFGKEHVESTQLLYDFSPCFKLGFMAANLAILEATLDQTISNKIHVIDFDIGQGGQYMNLLHALSARQNGNPSILKITAVADNSVASEEKLKVVGDMLSQVARRVGVCLRFNVPTCSKFVDLSRDLLSCESDEVLAVNFAFKLFRMPDESVSTDNPRDELLRRVKGLSPTVVTLVEQEMNTNTAPFMSRVNEVCAYYGALFDSIESTASRDNSDRVKSDRVKVEEGLGRKLANSVACEGTDRVERCEVFGKWRARMSMAGFELKPMSQKIAEAMRTRLVNLGFTVKEENGGVSFAWMGRTLTVASAWC